MRAIALACGGAAALVGCSGLTGDQHFNTTVSFMNANVANCYAANPPALSGCCHVVTFTPDGSASMISGREGSPSGTYSVDGSHVSGTIWYGQAFGLDLQTLVGSGAMADWSWTDDDPAWDAKVCNGPL